jgi:branched-chain amino acid transport system substrate-binding protein
VALVGEDTKFGQNILTGARANVEKLGLKVVYDRIFPASTVDHTPIVRAVQAANPDIVFVASYPAGSTGMVRAANEIGYKPRMPGGAMIGLQHADQGSARPVAERTGDQRELRAGADNEVCRRRRLPGEISGAGARCRRRPHRILVALRYAEMKVLAQAVGAVGSLDQAKIAAYLHKTPLRPALAKSRTAGSLRYYVGAGH